MCPKHCKKSAEVMTQVRKQGGHGKEASMLFFPTRSLELFVMKALPIF